MKPFTPILAAGAICGASLFSASATTLTIPDVFKSFSIPGSSGSAYDWIAACNPQWFQGSFQMIVPDNHPDVSQADLHFNYYAFECQNKFYLAITNEGSSSASRTYIANSLAFDFGTSKVTNTTLILPPELLPGIDRLTNYTLPEGEFLNPDFANPASVAYKPLENWALGNFQVFLAGLDATGETLANFKDELDSGALRIGMNVNISDSDSPDNSRCVPDIPETFSVCSQTGGVIPEPSTATLSLLALSALCLRHKRKSA